MILKGGGCSLISGLMLTIYLAAAFGYYPGSIVGTGMCAFCFETARKAVRF
ncbi:hypothetical protein YA0745_27540 [Pseudomonas synxantha]|uniref:Uncharacterized protein n=1 Tax=Pseudomonas synxantha TaxID=47883 RepID=A0ABS0UJ55_9PSED|nr:MULTISPECIES: hypothetical protein [Pseudomonas]MBI6565196.1 hypothetical protein [Pseudomonas synxantha]MBI6579910.1 hypothetical protein [Pseudomonas synxantha]MBI6646678.1 hypothetical protein [Pseudomonas synxantha]